VDAETGIEGGIRRIGLAVGRSVWETAIAAFIGTALLPHVAYRLRWPTRLRGWRLLAYIAFNTLAGFGVRQVVMPRIRSSVAAIDQMRTDLGREPTREEIAHAIGVGPAQGASA
jgi:hypothetical protein